MSRLEPLSQLSRAGQEALSEQLRLRHRLLDGLLSRAQAATSPESLLGGLAAHSASLVELGLHDEAARLNAFARAVIEDAHRFATEAALLEALLASLSPVDSASE